MTLLRDLTLLANPLDSEIQMIPVSPDNLYHAITESLDYELPYRLRRARKFLIYHRGKHLGSVTTYLHNESLKEIPDEQRYKIRWTHSNNQDFAGQSGHLFANQAARRLLQFNQSQE